MATIGKKKRTKKQPKVSLPRYYKQVAKSVQGKKGGYDITNAENLAKYFTKKGGLKKSALRSNKQREEFNKELQKAKEEIKQLQKEKKALQEELKRERANAKKRKKQNETYAENGRTKTHNLDTYNDFIDILDEVYDEVSLIFYDSDQIMKMLENPDVSRDDIKKLLSDMYKRKEESLTNEEKELLKNGKYKISKKEHERLTDEVSNALYLSSKTGGEISPEEFYLMKENNAPQYYQKVQELLTDDEIRKYIK